MAIQSNFSYSEIVSLGLPFWRLQIGNWGNRGAGADADSIAYTGSIPEGAAAVVIGPDSTADQVIVNYNEVIARAAYAAPQPGSNQQISMSVGIARPGVQLSGPLGVRTSFSTQFTDTYFRDGDPVVKNFGTAEPLFEAPVLQMLFYPAVPPVVPGPKRADMYRTSQVNANGGVGAETLIGIWPVMGRSCKALYFRATGDLVANVRVGAIVDVVTTQAGVATSRATEDTVATAALSAVTGVQESIITGRPMQWIAAYYTRVSGAGFINTNLVAQDC